MESSKQVSFNNSIDIRNIPPRGVGREIKEFKDDFIPGDSVNSALARIAARSSNQKPLSFTLSFSPLSGNVRPIVLSILV